jgi:hypothetical protein
MANERILLRKIEQLAADGQNGSPTHAIKSLGRIVELIDNHGNIGTDEEGTANLTPSTQERIARIGRNA